MKVEVKFECGHDLALLGMSYSYKERSIPTTEWWTEDRIIKAIKRANILAHKGLGEDKFLESITVYIDIEAPRAWWSEFDTYRVGTTKQSESTMHTLAKRAPTIADFEPGTSPIMIAAFQEVWKECKGNIHELKMALPEGFLQRRLVVTNYKVLRNIIAQRKNHRLKLWSKFEEEIVNQVEHKEYLIGTED